MCDLLNEMLRQKTVKYANKCAVMVAYSLQITHLHIITMCDLLNEMLRQKTVKYANKCAVMVAYSLQITHLHIITMCDLLNEMLRQKTMKYANKSGNSEGVSQGTWSTLTSLHQTITQPMLTFYLRCAFACARYLECVWKIYIWSYCLIHGRYCSTLSFN